ncbi:SEC-C domain-containing protein (plasmid) [Rossellomorea sp. AcN35-11]|nr:SEC-C domain-containing protein [Rossellomorea aquimaris]WJV32124.1 SEC-C domain-containing protein [Rossellomorea sp. AcN35-11]
MSKIKRNQPCNCGSGKKYKRCCGSSNPDVNRPELVDLQLNDIHKHFVQFIKEYYVSDIDKVARGYRGDFAAGNQEVQNIYTGGLIPWLINFVPVLKGNRTIYENVFDRVKYKVFAATKEKLALWGSCLPSVYEVLEVADSENEFIAVDVVGGERYKVIVQGDTFIKGSLLVGTLIPYMNHYTFLYNVVKLYQHDKDILIDYMKEVVSKDGGMEMNYPEFLIQTLGHGMEAAKLDNPQYEEVAKTYLYNMAEKEVKNEIILKGFNHWKEYCLRERPYVKKVEAVAAGLEYMVHKVHMPEESVTQSQIAKEYGVSPGTVSSNYRKLTAGMEDNMAS